MPTPAGPRTKSNPHLGSSLDSFLEEEGLLEEAEAVAIKRAIALELGELMASAHLSKSAAAGRLKTSRAAVGRLLDPNNTSVTLLTLNRAARALGRRLKIQLVGRRKGAAKSTAFFIGAPAAFAPGEKRSGPRTSSR